MSKTERKKQMNQNKTISAGGRTQFDYDDGQTCVAHMGEQFALEQDSQDIQATLEGIGRLDALDETGCLFTEVVEGDYGRVYQCMKFVPVLTARVYRLR